MSQKFRFAASGGGNPTSRAAWAAHAKKVESLGYSTLVVGQHLGWGSAGPIASLAVAAAATTTLRVGCHPFPIDFYHPAVLAQEAATLDLLTDGRLELGLGAGWFAGDYTSTGIRFDPPRDRVSRLEEAVCLIKRLLQGETVTTSGAHYQTSELRLGDTPAQRPHPPIFIGGGRKRVLSLAGREANIVGLDLASTPAGRMAGSSWKLQAMEAMVDWVRDAAGERLPTIELHVLLHTVAVTDDRRRGAEEALHLMQNMPPTIAEPCDLSTGDVLESPHALIGTADQIVETLRERRERLGITYYTVRADHVDTFAPVVAQLAGT